MYILFLAAGLALLQAAALAALPPLPERAFPIDHPCLLPDSLVEPLATSGGDETRVARFADGRVVLRTSASMHAAARQVLAILEDVEGWPRFIKRIRSLSVLPSHPLSIHVVFDTPWPLSDRDYAFFPAVVRDGQGGGTVFWEASAESVPPKKQGVVRVARVRGGFAVSPGKTEGSSTLIYTELDSFGETLPAAAREAARTRGPREIVAALRSLLLQGGSPGATPSAASPRGRARIVEAAWLRDKLGSGAPPLVLDSRPRRDFEAGHIPGARNIDWKDFTAVRPNAGTYFFGNPSRWGLLAEPDARLTARLCQIGVSNGRSIVVMGDPEGWGEEGRIAWMLLALGARDVSLLDGGYPSWKSLPGAEVERGPASDIEPGDFEPVPQGGRRVRLDELRSLLAEGRRALLDARTREEFEGKRLRGQKRGGRIPGARLVPAASLYDASGRYVSAGELNRLAGPLSSGAPPITYCTGGVRSALLAVLLEARLGIIAANYDGSLWEWGARPELPLETGPLP
ncbi:MAG: hypothetical protein IT186_15790 [Acidobacteria bacterium]|nr:hypothetical protein [Acidobacteriota bacterium]